MQGKVGLKLRQEMERQGLSQTDLERKTGIKQPQISRMLSGRSGIGAKHLFLLADALGLSVDALRGDASQASPMTTDASHAENSAASAENSTSLTLEQFLASKAADNITRREARALEKLRTRFFGGVHRATTESWLELVKVMREEFPID